MADQPAQGQMRRLSNKPLDIKTSVEKRDESKNIDTDYGKMPTDRAWTTLSNPETGGFTGHGLY